MLAAPFGRVNMSAPLGRCALHGTRDSWIKNSKTQPQNLNSAMTYSSARRHLKPVISTSLSLGLALAATLAARAQTDPATKVITTTTTKVVTTKSDTNVTTTTNVTVDVELSPPPVKWQTTATFGLTVTGGNTKTLLTTLDFQTQRKSAKNEILLDANGTYGENNNVKNAEQFDANGQYNRLATERLYYGLSVDGYHDGIAGIDYRLTVSPLVGYYFIKAPNTSLVGEVGPGYVYQRNEGSDTTLSHAALRVAERFEHKFSPSTRVWQKVEFIPEVNNFGNWYADGEVGIDTSISKHASLTSYVQDTYYQVPTPGRLKNDIKLVTGLTYKF